MDALMMLLRRMRRDCPQGGHAPRVWPWERLESWPRHALLDRLCVRAAQDLVRAASALRTRVLEGRWPADAWRGGWYLRGFLEWATTTAQHHPTDARAGLLLLERWRTTVLPGLLADLALGVPGIRADAAARVPPDPDE